MFRTPLADNKPRYDSYVLCEDNTEICEEDTEYHERNRLVACLLGPKEKKEEVVTIGVLLGCKTYMVKGHKLTEIDRQTVSNNIEDYSIILQFKKINDETYKVTWGYSSKTVEKDECDLQCVHKEFIKMMMETSGSEKIAILIQ